MKRCILTILCSLLLSGIGQADTALSSAPARPEICSRIEQAVVQAVRTGFPEWQNAVVSAQGKFSSQLLQSLADIAPTPAYRIEIIIPENSIPGQKLMVKVKLWTGEVTVRTFYVMTILTAIADRCIAARDIAVQEKMTADMIEERSVDLAVIPIDSITAPREVTGLEARTIIKKGEVLKAWMFQPRPLFRKGDEVVLVYRDGDLVLRLKGKAVEDGFPGKKVKCYRINSVKSFVGIVQNDGTVIID